MTFARVDKVTIGVATALLGGWVFLEMKQEKGQTK